MKYYFLAAYLPELDRDDRKLRVDLRELLGERVHMTGGDAAEIDLVLLARDVFTVERLLMGKEVAVEHSIHDVDFWREQSKSPQEGPEFLLEFLSGLEPGRFGPAEADRLYGAYYDHVLNVSGSTFLKSYVAFERDLRNVLAAVRARRQGLPPAEHLVGADDLTEALARQSTEDFGLGDDYPWIEEVQVAGDPAQLADVVERVLWEAIDARVGSDPFAFSAILAYLLKVQLIVRRLGQSEADGMEKVRRLGAL